MLDMPRIAEFYTRKPHFEKEEVFSSINGKLDLPFSIDEELHRPKKVNFSHLGVSKRITRARVKNIPIITEEQVRDA